ncbi:TIGR02678 family protein [Thioalkalivibrio sp. AKL17]|uniref:TIGR02678 family protein n=1 Tax=Thioalkalivibrio sp. AKL17 TaxID=1158160 RepID=UPI00037E0CA9|nr:TIGR02678 family protein [Thioalkalivibrio sp. AKL17]
MADDATLTDVLERNRADERQRALRALLLNPLMDARHPAFVLVRRHQTELRDWLAANTGWQLQVESEFARLHKRPADFGDPTRPATTGSGAQRAPFHRRRYALLCLALANLERGDNQVTLGRLGEALIQEAADPALEAAGLDFGLEGRDERRDLVATVRLLLELGVLSRVAGNEDDFVRRGRDGDVLYDIHRRVLAALLVTLRGPSLVVLDGDPDDFEARLRAIVEPFVPDNHEARNRALRQDLTARLLDDPVVYWDDLDDAARQYLAGQRGAITRRIQEATGLVAEVRAEGIAMVDPQQSLTDRQIPSEGTEGHATLLIAAYLAGLGEVPVTLEHLAERIAEWRESYRGYWRRNALEPGAERPLARQAVEQLRGLRLIRIDDQGRVSARPALARFAVDEPRTPEGAQVELVPGEADA